MYIKLVVASLLIVSLSGCDSHNSSGHGMMGGGGMMGVINIPGKLPPQETDIKYQQGYQQAKFTCSQCHTMPNPNQHTGAEWRNVIPRMEKHIRTYKKIMPDIATLKSITQYYVGNSNDRRQ